ncbi:MAG: RtcB family protein [Caldisericaceae bacterium]
MEIQKVDEFKYFVPKSGDMNVPAVIYTSPKLFAAISRDLSLSQLINVTKLPGIINYAIGMPDMHQGYAFPIGGVAAFDLSEGVVSPGGVGFDINCGVRVIKTNLRYEDIEGSLDLLGRTLFKNIPSGVGSRGLEKFTESETIEAMKLGTRWAVEKGFGELYDEESIEDYGSLNYSEPESVSKKAIDRGREELGTLGAGNHFIEVDSVNKVFDESVATKFGLFEGQIVIWIHTGSRGLGHQIASDYLEMMRPRMDKYKIPLFEHDFVSLPIRADESQRYLGAMAAAANFAWVNRQIITYYIRKSFEQVFKMPFDKLGMSVLYDVAHNIAKTEQYVIGGKERSLLIHRKGATRSFPKEHKALNGIYREVGQPVLLPGDMMRGSYILVGSEKSVKESFGSVAHGAGRLLSRGSAVKQISYEEVQKEMHQSNILLFAADKIVAREEAPIAYKSVDDVIEPIVKEGLASTVVRTKPVLVVKG